MDYSIDYLSFTVPFEPPAEGRYYELGELCEQAVSEFLGVSIHAVLDNQPFTVFSGRAPYKVSWGRADGGVRIFGSPTLSNVLVEITGTGCKTLRSHEALEKILSMVGNRASRVDLAVDMLTTTTPAEFAAKRDVERFKTISDIRSATGETYYVGSQKSDRFARVYRFAPPHPRSASLRSEHVFRRDAAKAFIKSLLAGSYAGAVAACGKVYGWAHSAWEPGTTEPMELVSGQTRQSAKNTVNWLYGTVSSAVAKAYAKDDIDLEHFIAHLRQEVASYGKELVR